MDIKIEENKNEITLSEKSIHDEKSLLETYRQESMAIKVQEHIIEKTPEVIASMNIHIQLTQESIKLNESRQEKLKPIFEELGINVKKRIQKIKEKYSMEDLLAKATSKLENTKTEIVKDGDSFVMTTSIKQSTEDMLIEFMSLQDSKPDLIEKLINQTKAVDSKKGQIEKAQKIIDEKQEKLNTISEFFSKQGKDVNKLLDQQAQSRTKEQKTAEKLPVQ